MEEYLRNVKLLRNYEEPNQDPVFTQVVELDLSTVVSSVSGPKRPHDRVSVSEMKNDFLTSLSNKVIQYFQKKKILNLNWNFLKI